MWGGRNGGVVTSPDGKVALIEEAGVGTAGVRDEELPRCVEAASEEGQAAKKPRASEEIVIEEISIDGMCGVY
jgi:mycofactocin precursor